MKSLRSILLVRCYKDGPTAVLRFQDSLGLSRGNLIVIIRTKHGVRNVREYMDIRTVFWSIAGSDYCVLVYNTTWYVLLYITIYYYECPTKIGDYCYLPPFISASRRNYQDFCFYDTQENRRLVPPFSIFFPPSLPPTRPPSLSLHAEEGSDER